MTWRQAPLAPHSLVYNEYGKVTVSGFCSAERKKAGHLLGSARISKLMTTALLVSLGKHLASLNQPENGSASV